MVPLVPVQGRGTRYRFPVPGTSTRWVPPSQGAGRQSSAEGYRCYLGPLGAPPPGRDRTCQPARRLPNLPASGRTCQPAGVRADLSASRRPGGPVSQPASGRTCQPAGVRADLSASRRPGGPVSGAARRDRVESRPSDAPARKVRRTARQARGRTARVVTAWPPGTPDDGRMETR